jgi:hypothetical protein
MHVLQCTILERGRGVHHRQQEQLHFTQFGDLGKPGPRPLLFNSSEKASFEHNLIKRLCVTFLGIFGYFVIIEQCPVHVRGLRLKRIFVDLE